jgi:hypothetical protein
MAPNEGGAEPAGKKTKVEAAAPAAAKPPPTPPNAANVQATLPPPPPDTAKVDGSAPASPVMHQMYPWVVHSLIHFMGTTGFTQFATGKQLREYNPLVISNVKDELVSYKAPWSTSQTRTAVETTSMYEVGGNLFWVSWRSPAAGEAEIIASMPPRWS